MVFSTLTMLYNRHLNLTANFSITSKEALYQLNSHFPFHPAQRQYSFKKFYLFICYAGSLLLCRLFSSCDRWGYSSCCVQASDCGNFSCCRAQALGCKRFSSSSTWAQ